MFCKRQRVNNSLFPTNEKSKKLELGNGWSWSHQMILQYIKIYMSRSSFKWTPEIPDVF